MNDQYGEQKRERQNAGGYNSKERGVRRERECVYGVERERTQSEGDVRVGGLGGG